MKYALGLVLFSAMAAFGSNNVTNCPWFAFHFTEGSAEISDAEGKAFETFLKTITDKTGKVRIYGASAEVEPGEKKVVFQRRADQIREIVEAWQKDHPRWVITQEARLAPTDGIKKFSLEVEFHGYDDPHRHEKTLQEETKSN